MYKKILVEDILNVIKQIGPCQPPQVKKFIEGSDTMMIGALLSSLLAKGELFVSKTKKGGSPFYYTQEQIPKLEQIAQYLNEKDARAYELLKKNKVLRDKDLTPLLRVCLRNIPDFAKKIDTIVENEPEVFWRYFLVPQNEAPAIIKHILGIEEPKIEKNEEHKREKQEEIRKTQEAQNPAVPKKDSSLSKQTTLQEKEKQTTSENKEDISKLKQELEELKRIIAKNNITPTQAKTEDSFVVQVKVFCMTKNIEILETQVIKKIKEFEFKARLTTTVGEIYCFGVAKAKKRLNEKEIQEAFEKAQQKQLPLICIAKGELSKKLQGIVKEKFFNTLFLNIEENNG